MAARNKVVFHFDVVSPWSALAFHLLRRYREAWELDVIWKPVNQGFVNKFAGNVPPMTVPNKGVWMTQDMARATRFYQVPLQMSSKFPMNTSRAQLFIRELVESPLAPTLLEPTIDAFFKATWLNDLPVATEADVQAICAPVFGSKHADALSSILAASATAEGKKRLKDETEEAVKDGQFGVPWMIVTRKDGEEERWFGSDRFEQMAAFLGKPYRGPLADGSTPKL